MQYFSRYDDSCRQVPKPKQGMPPKRPLYPHYAQCCSTLVGSATPRPHNENTSGCCGNSVVQQLFCHSVVWPILSVCLDWKIRLINHIVFIYREGARGTQTADQTLTGDRREGGGAHSRNNRRKGGGDRGHFYHQINPVCSLMTRDTEMGL